MEAGEGGKHEELGRVKQAQLQQHTASADQSQIKKSLFWSTKSSD
jgi:hypothetical protein